MTGYPSRIMVLWVALLTLGWLALFSPFPLGWSIALAVLVIFGAIWGCVHLTRRIQERNEATHEVLGAIDAALIKLPPDFRRNTPLVIVVGNNETTLTAAFGNDRVHVTDAAIWVKHENPSDLMHLADALKRWRGGQGPDALAWLVDADAETSESELTAQVRRWRIAVNEAKRAIGYTLPICMTLYAREPQAMQDDCPWFGETGGKQLDKTPASHIAQSLALYVSMSPPNEREKRAYRAARLDALAQWASMELLPLTYAARDVRSSVPLYITALGVTATQGRPLGASLYRQFMRRVTALHPAVSTGSNASNFPLPAPLIQGITMQPVRHPLPRALAHAFAALAVAFSLASITSARNNHDLITHIHADMERYRAIPAAHDAARVDALNILRHDRDELQRYALSGIPAHLGIGLYRGGLVQEELSRLIASYQPPPTTVELDSMSLFDSGKAILRVGSNRTLVSALEMIQAHPDKRVLIAGYTDSVGNEATNLKLSTARAAAVRDWLIDASGLPETRFAIQGYGATHPKAENDTEAGRAANRRVTITLIPDTTN